MAYRFIADKILTHVAGLIKQRGVTHGGENKEERNMVNCVTAFNALTSHNLSTLEGWTFMQCLKLSRAFTGENNKDDWDDLVGYAALAAEEFYNKGQHYTKEEYIESLKPVVVEPSNQAVYPGSIYGLEKEVGL